MTPTLLDGITTAEVREFAKAIPNPSDYLLTNEIIPNREQASLRWKTKNQTLTRNTAKYRNFDAETPIGNRPYTLSTTEGTLPPLGQKLPIGELVVIMNEMARGSDNSELIQQIYDDVENNVMAIRSRLELAAGDVLTDGKFTLAAENGITYEVDFQVPSVAAPDVLWDDSSGDQTPLQDEMEWEQARIDAGYGPSGQVVTSRAVMSLLGKSLDYRQDFYGLGVGSTAIPANLTDGQIASVRAQRGLPPIKLYDLQVSVDGTLTRPIPANRFIRLPADSRQVCETILGPTAEALALANSGLIIARDAPGITATRWYEEDPVAVWTKASATGMPVIYAPTYIQSVVVKS
jgi:hypothetical protein